MKPESRISGAVGILMAGFFTAMVLRPEAEKPQPETAALQNTSAISHHLAHRGQRPYLPGTPQSNASDDRARQLEKLLKLTSGSQSTTDAPSVPARPIDPALVEDVLPSIQPGLQPDPAVQPKQPAPANVPVLTEADEREHHVEHGDTLSELSLKYYGTVRHVDRIFQANRHQLSSPNALQIGMTLIIPPLNAELDQSPELQHSPSKDVQQHVPEPVFNEAVQAPVEEPRRLQFTQTDQKHSLMSDVDEERSLFVPFRRIEQERQLHLLQR